MQLMALRRNVEKLTNQSVGAWECARIFELIGKMGACTCGCTVGGACKCVGSSTRTCTCTGSSVKACTRACVGTCECERVCACGCVLTPSERETQSQILLLLSQVLCLSKIHVFLFELVTRRFDLLRLRLPRGRGVGGGKAGRGSGGTGKSASGGGGTASATVAGLLSA